MLQIIADQSWNPFAPFGVTSWEPFLANLIAFILMVVILRYVAFKPIQNIPVSYTHLTLPTTPYV